MNIPIIKRINILLALQTKRYFASTDKTFLEGISNAYRIMKPVENNIAEMRRELFRMVNDGG